MEQVHQIDRITPEDEVRLSGIIQESLSTTIDFIPRAVRAKVSRKSKLSFGEIAQCLTEPSPEVMEAMRRGLEARSQLVVSNLRLVRGGGHAWRCPSRVGA